MFGFKLVSMPPAAPPNGSLSQGVVNGEVRRLVWLHLRPIRFAT